MELAFFWVAGAIIAGAIANDKGRSGFGFFLLSIILSPVLGIIIALIAQSDQKVTEARSISKGAMKKCPYCAELIKREATICRYCQKEQ